MPKLFTFRLLLTTLLCWLNARAASAQVLDQSFQPTVLKTPFASVIQSGVNTLAVQPDGKVLAAGGFDFVNGSLTGKLQRFDAAGNPDAAFNVGGTGANGFISSIVLQPDGKILVGGGFTTFNGQALPMVVRLNANGSLDTGFSFGTASSFRQIGSIALQPDGKILVGSGTTFSSGPNPSGALVRLLPTGALDPAFNGGTTVTSGVITTILVQVDGSIVVGGSFQGFNGQQLGNLVRLTSNGALDPAFAYNTPTTNATAVASVTALVQQPDGRLLVAGAFAQNGATTTQRLVRLLLDGTMDGNFQPGTGPNNSVRSLALDASGNILLGGTFTQVNGVNRNRVARLTATGTLDANFGDPAGANATVNAVALVPGGQVLVGGVFNQYNAVANSGGLVRLNAGTGVLDSQFAPNIEARGTITQAVPLPNGQTLVAGNFLQFNSAALPGLPNAVRRLNADGTLDASFVSQAPPVAVTIQAVQPNGSFYALGTVPGFSTGTGNSTVTRLLASGGADNSFTAQSFGGATGSANTIYYLNGAVGVANGQLLVFGFFGRYGTLTGLSGLVRLSPDGTPDNTFGPTGLPATGRISQVVVHSGGKLIVVSNDFTNGSTTLVRLNANGTPDNTFSVGTAAGTGASYTVLVQPDGRLLVSGSFTSFNGQSTPYGLTRLTVNGTPDPTFSGLAAGYSVRQMQPDGRLLVFSSTNSATNASNRLLRLNPDGSVDNAFVPVAIPSGIFLGDDVVNGVVFQPTDGKILLYGSFRYVAGPVRIGLARLTNIGLATRAATAIRPLSLYPNPAQAAVTVVLPAATQPRPATLLDLNGRPVRRWTLPAQQTETRLNLEAIAAGMYLLQVRGQDTVYQQKLVVAP